MHTLQKIIFSCLCSLFFTVGNFYPKPKAVPFTYKQRATTPTYIVNEKENPKHEQSCLWDVSDVCIDKIDPARKLIAFTFDDAPAKTLESIVSVFASFNESNPDCVACATLFCNGHRITANGMQQLKAAHLLGFEMGNHGYSHSDPTTLTKPQLQSEIERTDRLLYAVDGKRSHLFRAPFGNVNDTVRIVAQTPIISWTIDTLDWTKISANFVYDAVMSNLFNGAIVLMHDGYEGTVYALKRLLPDLKARGYQVVSVSQMAKMHTQNLARGKVYIRIRKNGNGK